MTRFYAYFKPENFYPVPTGTILRYAGHDYSHDTKQHCVVMDVIGEPVQNELFPEIIFVDNTVINIPKTNDKEETSF